MHRCLHGRGFSPHSFRSETKSTREGDGGKKNIAIMCEKLIKTSSLRKKEKYGN